MTFTFAEPTQLWLALLDTVQDDAWQHSQVIDRPGGCWQSYLNQLCLRTLIPWLQSERSESITADLPLETPPTAWELVNGNVVCINDIRVAVIPVEGIGQDALEVPQEWVDIPSWAADYYLAVQVDVDDGWLVAWGYTTYQNIKALSQYNGMERLYIIGRESLICDVNALWSTLSFYSEASRDAVLMLLEDPSEAQATSLLTRLSHRNQVLPRLSVPFAQWAALLDNPIWRQQLYQQRLAAWQDQSASSINLRAWFGSVQTLAQSGWQSIEAIFGSSSVQLADSLRGVENESEEILPITHKVTAVPLGELTIRLTLQCQQTEDERVRIEVRLYPSEGEAFLPEGVQLVLVSEEGNRIQTVEAGAQDNFVRLKRFKPSVNDSFSLLVVHGEDEQVYLFRA